MNCKWYNHKWSAWCMMLVITSVGKETWQSRCCKKCAKIQVRYLFHGTTNIEVTK